MEQRTQSTEHEQCHYHLNRDSTQHIIEDLAFGSTAGTIVTGLKSQDSMSRWLGHHKPHPAPMPTAVIGADPMAAATERQEARAAALCMSAPATACLQQMLHVVLVSFRLQLHINIQVVDIQRKIDS